MYTFVHKSIKLSLAAGLLLLASSSFAYEGKKDAIDGGMTYPTKDGKYTAYSVNDQKVGPITYGRKATEGELKAWDTDIRADGVGLPEGKGSVEEGDELYEKHCVICHGDFGAGGKGYPTLTNTDIASLKNQREYGKTDAPHRAIGSYWPTVTTLLWYIKDAMPYATGTKSLTEDESYALTAYLLSTNEIKVDGKELDDEFVLSKDNILKAEMPNKDGFVPNIDGADGPKNVKAFLSDGKNYGAIGKRCMKDCKDPGATGKEAKAVFINDPRTDVTPAFNEEKSLPLVTKDSAAKPGQADYEASCAACHGNDQMGAPDLGNKEAWAKVMEKGIDKVVASAVKGKGAMPPKGGTDFSDDKLKAIIEYMYSQSK